MLRFNQPPLLKHWDTNTYRWTHQLRGCLCLELLSCEQCPAAPSSAQGSVRDTGESWWLKESETHILLHYVQTWMTAQRGPLYCPSIVSSSTILLYQWAFLSLVQPDGWKWPNSYTMALNHTIQEHDMCARCKQYISCFLRVGKKKEKKKKEEEIEKKKYFSKIIYCD